MFTLKQIKDQECEAEGRILKNKIILGYLVEKVNNLGQNVQASSWVDGCLVEDASLRAK